MKRVIYFLLVALILSGTSCAGGGSGNPATPNPGLSTAGDSSGGSHVLWGLWQVAIDTRSGDVDILPIRGAAFHANVVQYLQHPFPNGIGIDVYDIDMDTGIFDIVVRLTHPFDDASLTGFDVKGIFIAHGTAISQYDTYLQYPDVHESRLLNADGYTRWWNPDEFTEPGVLGYTEGVLGSKSVDFHTKLNPFKYFANHLGPDDDFYLDPDTRNSFSASAVNSRRYIIKFPLAGGQPVITFNYAVDANWEAAIGDPNNIWAFPPEANQPEAYQITVADLGSSAWFDPVTETSGGLLNLRLGISDYGGSENPQGTMGELEHVVLESQTLFALPIFLTETDLVSQYDDTAIFEVLIEDIEATSTADQEILIHAVASEGTYDQGFGTPAPDEPLAAYAIHTATVNEGMPVPPAPTILNVDTERDVDGKLTGFLIDWDDVPGAAQYLVYWSTDPYENDGPLDFVLADGGSVPGLTSEFHHTISGAEVNGQWLLYVVARGVVAEPVTDSPPSNQAFIDFEAFEDFVEGQNEWRRRHNSIRNSFISFTTGTYGVGSSGALLLEPQDRLYRNAIAYCVSPEVPQMTGATTCFLEYAHNRTVLIPDDYGYSVCSTPIIQDPDVISQYFKHPSGPTFDYMVISDENIDVVDAAGYLSGDQMNDMDIDGMYWRYNLGSGEDGDPTNGWAGLPSTGFAVSRYEVPRVIHEDHIYVGICFAGAEFGIPIEFIDPPQYPLICDELALVIF